MSHPGYDINDYLFYSLFNGVLSHKPFPVQTVPEAKNPPYMTWVARERPIDGERYYWEMTDIVYVIYHTDHVASLNMFNQMKHKFKLGSASAKLIQEYAKTLNNMDFYYHSIEFRGGGNPEPADDEGTVHSRSATLAVAYTSLLYD